jgi:hypothetical protein
MTQQIMHPQQKSVQELLSGCFDFSSSQIEYTKYNLKEAVRETGGNLCGWRERGHGEARKQQPRREC